LSADFKKCVLKFLKTIDFINLKWYNAINLNAIEQKQVSLERTWRELPVGARQR
jgi:hypothetical protein